jgi:hypothetical protein
MYSKGPLSSKTSSISSIFHDLLGFRTHLQVFECFCKFSSHDFTVPQISAAQINATARTNKGLWKSQCLYSVTWETTIKCCCSWQTLKILITRMFLWATVHR